jgi:hypothetical protein
MRSSAAASTRRRASAADNRIRRLASEGDEFLAARAHVPLVIESDPALELALAMRLADVAPQDGVNLLGRRRRGGSEWIFMFIEPPSDDA